MDKQQDKQKLREQIRHDLKATFQAELRALKPLARLMEEETKALKSRDMIRIIEISEFKERLLGVLQAATAQRLQTMQILGYSPDATGLKDLLTWCDAGENLLSDSHLVYDLTKVCHDLNVQNGMQINKNQEFVNKSLNILLGLEQNEFTGYNASGSRTEDGEGRSITTI
jgi:flagellar biosynthesis/type III secretory pathway chaperone